MSQTRPADYRVIAKNTSADHLGSIHDDQSAQRFGYAGGLVPGITIYGYVCHVLAETWGEDWIRHGTMQSRSRRPAYEGESITINITDYDDTPTLRAASFEVLRGGEDKPLASGIGTLAATPPAAPDPDTCPILPMPEPPPLAAIGAIPVGHEMGTTTRTLSADDLEQYLGKLGESYPYYRERQVFPPSFVQQLTTRVERDNFEYQTPTIYVESWAQHHGEIRVGDVIRCPGVVTGVHERKGNHYIEVEHLVLAGDEVVARVRRNSIYHARDSRN